MSRKLVSERVAKAVAFYLREGEPRERGGITIAAAARRFGVSSNAVSKRCRGLVPQQAINSSPPPTKKG